MFYKNKEFKQIHQGERVNKFLNDEGLIISVSKKGKITETYGSDKGNTGYKLTRANLFGEGQQRVHRLVALLFIGNPPEGKDKVDHINAKKNDNRVCNLRWVNDTENMNNCITKQMISDGNSKDVKVIYKNETYIFKSIDETLEYFQEDAGKALWYIFYRNGVSVKYKNVIENFSLVQVNETIIHIT